MATYCGEKNPFWKGGRTVASNGYVLIRVGTGHPLADVRGYAYEHRLVAEKMLGRPLTPGEQVHHKDGNKQNNDPANLEVMADLRHHLVAHRKQETGRRLPDEPNVTVLCACGCGEQFDKFDAGGRPRRFFPGHNPPLRPKRDAVLATLADGPRTRQDIAALTGLPLSPLATMLSKMKQQGLVEQPKPGFWQVTDSATPPSGASQFPAGGAKQ